MNNNPRSLFLFLLLTFYFLPFTLLYAQEATTSTRDSTETTRYNTIRYGTETEIAALIQTLQSENADYLDNEIITLVENTRNRRILTGAFSFFAEREKGGLDDRAIRAIEEWEDEETDTVLAAIDYLGRVKASAAAPVLQRLIETGEARFMNAAFRALGRVSGSDGEASEEIAEYIIDFYENREPSDGYRRDMIVALGAAGSETAVDFLVRIAMNNDERFPLRIAALEAIALIESPAGLEAVLFCVSVNNPNIRSAAVAALGPFSGTAVDNAILDAFRDSHAPTRIAAARASRQRKLEAAVPYLRHRAEHDEVASVREEAIRSLGEISTGEAIEVIEGLFTERRNSVQVRIVSGEMLMQNQPERFLDSLIRELDEAKQRNQTALYNGLLRIIGGTTSQGMEPITRRLMQDRGVIERSYALDMAVNNNLTSLAAEIRVIADDRNEGLANKARRTMERLGIGD